MPTGFFLPALEIQFPVIDPVLVHLGPVSIRWYALAYIVGLVLGWLYCRHIVSTDRLWNDVKRPALDSLDDLLVYCALGVVLGGRAGYVLFYNPAFFLEHPDEIIAVWNGGMSFHGGLVGAAAGAWFFARKVRTTFSTVADICSAAVPIGLLLGRIANFIKPELWGRPTDVPWAMVFPGAGPMTRHPSQLYEAALEGALLFVLLRLVVMSGGLKRPGLTTGLFAIGYALARIASEFFREPDPQLGFLFGGATMGMLLSLPMLMVGIAFLLVSRRTGASG